jgi:hypothetical protein
MNLVKYNSPEEILAAFWHFEENDLTLEEFLESKGKAITEDGEEMEFSGRDEFEAVKRNGFWGYCHPETKTIHVWIGEMKDPEELIFFLAHELGHATGKTVDTGNEVQDLIDEEERANGYGEVARQAFKWLKELNVSCSV